MNVKNEIFYHFHRSNEWDRIWFEGNIFSIDKSTKNNFFKHYDSNINVFNISGTGYYPKIAAKKMIEILPSLTYQDVANYLNYSLTVTMEIAECL